jgi:hydroxymethylpyrimidine pyrophosphatase-like HAD family hydrolase
MRLVLATGRILSELAPVCPDLDVFDAVVAENGGVLYFPGDRTLRDEGATPPPRLLKELDARGVPYRLGRVLVATLDEFRDAVLDAMDAAHVTVDVVVNRSALMLLPPRVSKGTGVTRALTALGIAPREALAIGDADNDLPMFDACGWSACPDDAEAAVKRRANWIFPEGGGEGVGRAISERIVPGNLAPPRRRRRCTWRDVAALIAALWQRVRRWSTSPARRIAAVNAAPDGMREKRVR